jgi:hypothetical protein
MVNQFHLCESGKPLLAVASQLVKATLYTYFFKYFSFYIDACGHDHTTPAAMLTRLNTQLQPKDCLRLCGEMLCAKHVPNQVSKHFSHFQLLHRCLRPRSHHASGHAHTTEHTTLTKRLLEIMWGNALCQTCTKSGLETFFLTFSFYRNACGHAHTTPAAMLTRLNTQLRPKDCLSLCGEMLCAKHVPNQISKHFSYFQLLHKRLRPRSHASGHTHTTKSLKLET